VQWANEIKHNSNSFRYLRALGFLERDLCFYLAAMETNITLVRLPPPRPTAAANNFANAKEFTRRHYYTLSSMFLPSLSRAILHQTESLAVIRLSAAALAVERFRLARKRLPETLRELVPQFLSAVPIDPFDGQPLRYHPTAKRYLIYSVGAGVRDGGVREGPATPKPADQPPGTVTFTVAR
jgi:hypothetical protein